jgi:uncharacterized glyoxalase superfamily protein PhnB
MIIKKSTLLFVVETIEPALALWITALGYTEDVRVPHGDRTGFVILSRARHGQPSSRDEIMLQSRASLADDLPKIAALGVSSLLYVEVDSLDDAEKALVGAELLVPRRDTPYGAREIFVRDAAGVVMGFAQHGA